MRWAGAGEAPKNTQMKKRKIPIAILATLVLVFHVPACMQVETPEREISFQVASHVASVTKTDDYAASYGGVPFGAYAWYKGENPTDDADFMTNQKVIYDGAYWKPDGTTYYWPRSGSLDFICYSPYAASGGPAVTEDRITWTGWNVAANPDVDLMYATKAPGQTGPATTYYYNGVPTLFHHALAQVAVNVRLAYSEKEASTGDKTRWKVTVHDITLKNLYTTGSLSLSLGDDGRTWVAPATWTTSGSATDIALDCSELPAEISDETLRPVGESFLVLPQTLGTTTYVDMEISILTEHDKGDGYQTFLTESHIHVGGTLSSTALPAWGVNHRITYTFVLAPSLPTEEGGVQIPTEVHFDPAVDGWQEVTLNMNINI